MVIPVLGIQDLFYRVESLGRKAFLYAYAGEREKALRFDVDLAFFTFMRAYLFGMGIIGPDKPFSVPAVFQDSLVDFFNFLESIVCLSFFINQFT